MAPFDDFSELIGRLRRGQAAAADELWRRFEPLLRREVRLRLRDPRLRRRLDESDVCQSVMASFFIRCAAGQFDLDGPEQLLRLLTTMGRNKLATQARRHQAGRRDLRREEQLPPGGDLTNDQEPTPSQIVGGREILQQFRERLRVAERTLADRRADGCSWKEIAALVGSTPDGCRVQLNRAVARVCREMGLDENNDE